MYNIGLNKVITLVRGDTFYYYYPIDLGTYIDRNYYRMKDGDYIYFAICEPNQPFEEAVVGKRYGKSDCIEKSEDGNIYSIAPIHLSSEDTENLTEGKYYYTIKLAKKTDSGYDVITTQPKTIFFLV